MRTYMKHDFNFSRDEPRKEKVNKQPKQSRSISRKERDSFKQKSKQQLKNYVESNFEDDEFEDNFMR